MSSRNRDYKRAILEKLLKKYNSRLAKNTAVRRRILVRPAEFYKNYAANNADLAEKQRLHEAADDLLKRGMVTAERLKFSTDIEKLYLCEDKIDEIYELLKQEYGVVPQRTILEQAACLLQSYAGGVLTDFYCGRIRLQMEQPGAPLDLERIEANLKLLYFLEHNSEDLYVREVSVLVYGDSKWLERNNYEEICGIVRDALGVPAGEGEKNDAILARYHISPAEQEIFIRGSWRLEWEDYVLETEKLKGGVGIVSGDIDRLQRIVVGSPRVMTIENKTSYQRMDCDGIAAVYLGGFASRHQIAFLKKAAEDNPDAAYCHFGDIDVGGFLIHRHLCRTVGIRFEMYRMGIAELKEEKFRPCLKELTEVDRNRLEPLLAEEPYRETAAYMKEHGVKLEQEIVSYTICS